MNVHRLNHQERRARELRREEIITLFTGYEPERKKRTGAQGNKIGGASEKIVEIAFQQLQAERKIQWFRHVDKMGYDFIVAPIDQKKFKVEVKSSSSYSILRDHFSRYDTPVVVVEHSFAHALKSEWPPLVNDAKRQLIELINMTPKKRQEHVRCQKEKFKNLAANWRAINFDA